LNYEGWLWQGKEEHAPCLPAGRYPLSYKGQYQTGD